MPVPPEFQRSASRNLGLQLIRQAFKVAVIGQEQVAGRTAEIIEIRDKENSRLVRKMWIDHDKAHTLKWVTFGPDGKPETSYYFSEINYAPHFAPGLFRFEVPPEVTVRRVHRPGHVDLREAQRLVRFPILTPPPKLPGGYRLMEGRVTVKHIGKNVIVVLYLDNGLDPVTLVQSPCPPHARPLRVRNGDVWREGNLRLVLKGPRYARQALLQKIKGRLRPVAPPREPLD